MKTKAGLSSVLYHYADFHKTLHNMKDWKQLNKKEGQLKLVAALSKIIVKSDFKTVEKKFLDQGIVKEEVKNYLDSFKKLRDANRISDKSKKDIEYWGKKEFTQFKDFVDTLTASKSKSKMKKSVHKEAMNIDGAKLVAENADWLVYRIYEYGACKLLGSRNWCIVRDEDYWLDYTDTEYQEPDELLNNFYFILAKDRPEDQWYKIAIQADCTSDITVWDALDKSHNWGTFLRETKDLNTPKFNIEYPSKCLGCGSTDDCTCCSVCGRDADDCGCCPDCQNIDGNCTCCPVCSSTDRDNCGCCGYCGNVDGKCTCCPLCGALENDCSCCQECGNTEHNCTCEEEA